jgi:aspartyl-tRNA(Asn)/glutamyl-tRNA(Gln) amidotransferase subunit C
MLDRSQVLHIARLARLELTDAQVERMAGELSHVLEYIEHIRELNLSDVPPTSHVVDVAGVVRADEPRSCFPVEVALASAPEPVEVDVAGLPEPGLGFGVPSPGQAPGE